MEQHTEQLLINVKTVEIDGMNNSYRHTYYNPETNQILRRNPYHKIANGFISCGYKKVAEAMTVVSKEDRLVVWNSIHFGVDLTKLNSKLRHQLLRIGVKYKPERNWDKSEGEILLSKINKK